MRQFFCVLAVVGACILHPSPVRAATIFLDIPGITGESPVPGHPAAIEVQSITFSSSGFSIVKPLDKASPQIFAAVSLGTTFLNASALFYNATPTGAPDATYLLPPLIATSVHVVDTGLIPTETISFVVAPGPISMFLELPGITGEASTPGHPGVMALQSFTLAGQHFSVVRPVDKATPGILLAVAQGSFFAGANILFYDSTPAGTPVATLLFQQVLATSLHVDNGIIPIETDGFVFTSLSSGPIDSSAFTPTGAPVTVQPTDLFGAVQPVTVTFSAVTAAGRTAATPDSTTPPPADYQVNGAVYDIATTATYTAPVTVCFLGTFSPASQVLRYVDGAWAALPSRKLLPGSGPAFNEICARTTTLSPFAVGNRLRPDVP